MAALKKIIKNQQFVVPECSLDPKVFQIVGFVFLAQGNIVRIFTGRWCYTVYFNKICKLCSIKRRREWTTHEVYEKCLQKFVYTKWITAFLELVTFYWTMLTMVGKNTSSKIVLM